MGTDGPFINQFKPICGLTHDLVTMNIIIGTVSLVCECLFALPLFDKSPADFPPSSSLMILPLSE